MELRKTQFEDADIERYGSGAGIIPVSKNPSNEYFVLLGRERFLPQWKGSCRWSGFEGSRKAGETLKEAAVREFTEESLGVVASSNTVKERIDEKKYWVRVVLRIGNDRRAERYHATYVVQVPWDDSHSMSFDEIRREIERIERFSKELDRLFPGFASHTGVELGNVTDDGSSILLTRRVSVHCTEDLTSVLSEEYDEDDERLKWAITNEDGDEVEQVLVVPYNHPYSQRLKAWDGVRKSIEESAIAHPSVSLARGPHYGRVQDVKVQSDHLEKDQIRWWSVSDLRRVLDMKGCLGNDCFRPYFLPVLQTILHEFSHSPPET